MGQLDGFLRWAWGWVLYVYILIVCCVESVLLRRVILWLRSLDLKP